MIRNSIRLALITACVWTSPSYAQSASSSANALELNQTVAVPRVATANVTIGPIAATSGSAPPNYNVSNSVASLTQSASLGSSILPVSESLRTGILTSNSTGTATAASGTATVNDLAFGLSAFIDPSLLSLTARTITSSSQANSVGGLDASGTSAIEGLGLTGSLLGGLTINGSLFASAAPNTVLFNLGGLSIILNRQTMLGDGITGTGISTNAIYVGFDNFLSGTGLVNGSLKIANSQAFASAGVAGAVPEPATWAMMLIGFGAVGVSIRRRKSQTAALAAA